MTRWNSFFFKLLFCYHKSAEELKEKNETVRREMKESYSNHKTKCKILNYKTSIKKYTKKFFHTWGRQRFEVRLV